LYSTAAGEIVAIDIDDRARTGLSPDEPTLRRPCGGGDEPAAALGPAVLRDEASAATDRCSTLRQDYVGED